MLSNQHEKSTNTMSDRELLIRIDERQQMILNQIPKCEDRFCDVEDELEDKISKKSILWFVVVTGGLLGGLTTLSVFAAKIYPLIIK